jgi:hypothetical protein
MTKHCVLHEEISKYRKDQETNNHLTDLLIMEYEAFMHKLGLPISFKNNGEIVGTAPESWGGKS